MSRMINKEISDLKQRYQNERERTIQERIRQIMNLWNHLFKC